MRNAGLKLCRHLGRWRLVKQNQGQDLIEYALVVALIAFAAAAGMSSVATQINPAFTSIGTKVTTYTS
jgi:pilus assembly protein Flp/PilA